MIPSAIRKRATMSMGPIAKKLAMRTAADVTQQIRRHRHPETKRKLSKELRTWITLSIFVA